VTGTLLGCGTVKFDFDNNLWPSVFVIILQSASLNNKQRLLKLLLLVLFPLQAVDNH